MAVKKILMLVGDFVEDYEAMVPYQILTMVGHKVDTVCPEKKIGDAVKTAVHDFVGDQTYVELQGHNFAITADFSKAEAKDYDALVVPGGRAPEYLRLNPDIIKIVQDFAAAKKPIASICHGQQILTAAKVLQGVSCTAYPAVRPEIEACGGLWIDPSPGADSAYVHENIVTAPAWPAHPAWMREFLRVLGSTIEP